MRVLVRRRDERDQQGAVAVEFALVLPVLVSLLMGIIWFGFGYADHIAVTNAVREGARYGAVANTSSWASSVVGRVQQTYLNTEGLAGGSVLNPKYICARLVTSAGGDAATSAIGSDCGTQPTLPTMVSGSCAVVVWASKPRVVHLGIFPDLHFPAAGSSVSYYGRTAAPCPAQP